MTGQTELCVKAPQSWHNAAKELPGMEATLGVWTSQQYFVPEPHNITFEIVSVRGAGHVIGLDPGLYVITSQTTDDLYQPEFTPDALAGLARAIGGMLDKDQPGHTTLATQSENVATFSFGGQNGSGPDEPGIADQTYLRFTGIAKMAQTEGVTFEVLQIPPYCFEQQFITDMDSGTTAN